MIVADGGGGDRRRGGVARGRRAAAARATAKAVGRTAAAVVLLLLAACSSPSPGGTGSLPSPLTTLLGSGGSSTAGASTLTSTPTLDPQGAGTSAPTRPGGEVDVVRVEKCWTNATSSHGGQLLVKASSSDASAHLLVYRPDGSLIGEVQNGGGGRYGGSVMPYQRFDPVSCTVRSSAGGAATAPTGPFQPEN